MRRREFVATLTTLLAAPIASAPLRQWGVYANVVRYHGVPHLTITAVPGYEEAAMDKATISVRVALNTDLATRDDNVKRSAVSMLFAAKYVDPGVSMPWLYGRIAASVNAILWQPVAFGIPNRSVA